MSLFQQSIVKKYLKSQNEKIVTEKWEKYSSYFLNPDIQENIRQSKEEQYQEGFLRDLFVKILGYTLNPETNFNLTTELKNIKDSKKADGGILKLKSNGIDPIVIGVIELKGTQTTDLNSVETQAFGYKNNQEGCAYVITSNFEKLRFYIDNAIEHQEFNLFQLSKDEFDLLYLCLSYDNLSKDLPKKLKEESISHEDVITKKLYSDYSVFKRELFHNLTKTNPQYEAIDLFKKSQKLLDRFLFLFFAEDRQLLPPNSVRLILKQWKQLQELDEDIPLYNRFKKYFGYLNTGFKGKKYDVFPYNGGLFKPDDILDHIVIDDELLYKHTFKLSEYDFDSEIDVNILGHIFENSLNELEEIQSKIEEKSKQLESKGFKPLEKTISKRKKDGVFYTPKYITKYIVENTVGKLCEDKKKELEINDDVYQPAKQRSRKRLDNLQTYRDWLLQLTICDPACGSGAFLNQALDFLIAEHRYIDELSAKYNNDAFILSNVEKSILENNLFGVDLNEESVEIAKLSLWLRTAQPNRKLNDLSNNIKCGNSLIDDTEIAGNKAFKWQQEFPQVFKQKQLEAYHIVLTTHNSRTSQRMIDYKVQKGPAVEFTLEQEIEITGYFKNIITENQYRCLAYNICQDHVHLILVCEYEELKDIVKTLKGKSSYLYQSNGFKPIGEPLWSQKFYFADLEVMKPSEISYRPGYAFKEPYIEVATRYIQKNRVKHELPVSSRLQKIIASFVLTQEHAFTDDYKGGFDVVIGNPPYVRLESIRNVSLGLEKLNYKTYEKRGDLYALFVEQGINILKESGIISYIMPNKWLQAGYGKSLREFVLNFEFRELIDFGDFQIFEGATTYPCIINIKNDKPKNEINISVLKENNKTDFYTEVLNSREVFNHSEFSSDTWVISSKSNKELLEKLKNKLPSLSKFINGEANYGIKPGLSEAFIIDESKKDELIKAEKNSEKIIGSLLRGRDITRYGTPLKQNLDYIILARFGSFKILEKEYKSVYKYLAQFEEKLKSRGQCKGSQPTEEKPFFGQHHWLELDNNPNEDYLNQFLEPKIMYQVFQVKPNFIFDEQGLYCNNSMWIIPTNDKGLLAILNSKMGWWLITQYCTQIQNGYQLIWKYFGQIPIANTTVELAEKADQMLTLSKAFQRLVNKFLRTVERKFELENTGKKLEKWHELSFSQFIKEVYKRTFKGFKPLGLSQEAEWEDYFLQEQQKAVALKNIIDTTDKEIDAMVYELYGLTEEEIEIIERSIQGV